MIVFIMTPILQYVFVPMQQMIWQVFAAIIELIF